MFHGPAEFNFNYIYLFEKGVLKELDIIFLFVYGSLSTKYKKKTIAAFVKKINDATMNSSLIAHTLEGNVDALTE